MLGRWGQWSVPPYMGQRQLRKGSDMFWMLELQKAQAVPVPPFQPPECGPSYELQGPVKMEEAQSPSGGCVLMVWGAGLELTPLLSE